MPKSYPLVYVSKSKEAVYPRKPATSDFSRNTGRGRSGMSLRTPIRRFFKLEVHNAYSSGIGNKRSRSEDYNINPVTAMNPLINTPPLSSDIATSPVTEIDTPDAGQPLRQLRSVDQHYTPPAPCMALQNSDHSIDAVVISTLLKLPFCCHEDLLTMPPARIVGVAQEMNERLPEALKIDLSEPRDYNDIRKEVEMLVGIIKGTKNVTVPGAPLKRVKSRGRREFSHIADMNFSGDLDFKAFSPPSSPLEMISATRHRKRVQQVDISRILSPTKLAMLREEDEDEYENEETTAENRLQDAGTDTIEDVFRATKKRRTSTSSSENVEMITPTMCRIKAPLKLKQLYDDIDSSPTSRRILPPSLRRRGTFEEEDSSTLSARPGTVIVKTTVIDRSLAHTRARYRSSIKFSNVSNTPQGDRTSGPLQTSTPKLAQFSRENRSVRGDLLDVNKEDRRIEEPAAKRTPNPDDAMSRIPRYRRVKRGSRPSSGGIGDLAILMKGRKDYDSVNKTF